MLAAATGVNLQTRGVDNSTSSENQASTGIMSTHVMFDCCSYYGLVCIKFTML